MFAVEPRVSRIFFAGPTTQEVGIGYRYLKEAMNERASQLAQGKVYWNIRFTDVPPAENPNFRVEVTDQWLTEVLDVA